MADITVGYIRSTWIHTKFVKEVSAWNIVHFFFFFFDCEECGIRQIITATSGEEVQYLTLNVRQILNAEIIWATVFHPRTLTNWKKKPKHQLHDFVPTILSLQRQWTPAGFFSSFIVYANWLGVTWCYAQDFAEMKLYHWSCTASLSPTGCAGAVGQKYVPVMRTNEQMVCLNLTPLWPRGRFTSLTLTLTKNFG